LIDRVFQHASIDLCCFYLASNHVCGTIFLSNRLPLNHIPDTQWIVERAKSIGFDRCGVVRAEKFPELAQTSEWLAREYSGEMKYLADPRRSDPQSALPGFEALSSVCSLQHGTSTFDGNQAAKRSRRAPWVDFPVRLGT